jgi:hypothetical protein
MSISATAIGRHVDYRCGIYAAGAAPGQPPAPSPWKIIMVSRNRVGSGMALATIVASAMGAWILFSPPEVGATSGMAGIVGYCIGQATPAAIVCLYGDSHAVADAPGPFPQRVCAASVWQCHVPADSGHHGVLHVCVPGGGADSDRKGSRTDGRGAPGGHRTAGDYRRVSSTPWWADWRPPSLPMPSSLR